MMDDDNEDDDALTSVHLPEIYQPMMWPHECKGSWHSPFRLLYDVPPFLFPSCRHRLLLWRAHGDTPHRTPHSPMPLAPPTPPLRATLSHPHTHRMLSVVAAGLLFAPPYPTRDDRRPVST